MTVRQMTFEVLGRSSRDSIAVALQIESVSAAIPYQDIQSILVSPPYAIFGEVHGLTELG